jgi:hypothetical protein
MSYPSGTIRGILSTATEGIVDNVKFRKISREESWRRFDEAARRRLHVSGETFIRKWDAGEYKDRDTDAVIQVAMLRPSGR